MSDDDQSPREPPLGAGTTNSNSGSVVKVPVASAPALFLIPETGEIIGVPKSDILEFQSHYFELADVMAEYQSSIRAVQACEELRLEQAEKLAKKIPLSPGEEEQTEKVYGWSLDWRDEAHDKVQEKLEPLAPIDSSGKKLIELIELTEKKKSELKKDREKERGPKLDGGQIKIKLGGFKSPSDMKKLVKWPKKPFDKIINAHSDKVKKAWPVFKDEAATKWSDVYKKDKSGNRKIDSKKLHSYVSEQLKSTKFKSSDFVDIKYETSGNIFDWAESWNQGHRWQKEGAIKFGNTQLADVDLSASAQLMRYTMGGSLDFGYSPLKPGVEFKAEGHAEVALAEGKAAAELYLPAKVGWLWYIYDLEGNKHDLVAMRALISAELSAVVGASVAGELSLAVECKTTEPPKLKGKRGRKGKAARKRNAAINKSEDKDVGTVDAELSVFAGAKADAEFKGALEWRNPEAANKDFKEIADIAPKVGAMAGLAGELQFKVEVTDDGVFHLTAHASLCFGIGAEGEVTFAVSIKQIAEFTCCLYYHMLLWEFKNLNIVADNALQLSKNLVFLAVKEGKDVEAFYEATVLTVARTVETALSEFDDAEKQAKARQDLAAKILATPSALKYSTPEAKGMLIYQLSRHSAADFEHGGFKLGEGFLQQQKSAVLVILKFAQIKREAENVIQHIDARGEKKDLEVNLQRLHDFFKTAAPRDLFHTDKYDLEFNQFYDRLASNQPASFPPDSIALNGEFEKWYNAYHEYLMDSAPGGHQMARADSQQYALLKNTDDHIMYASSGNSAYYSNLT